MRWAGIVSPAVAVLVTALHASPALGDKDKDTDKEPSAEVRAKASSHVEKGQAFQEQGNYSEAIKQYRAAYRLIPHPQLLYNIGQAYRLKGDKRRAIKLYNEYLSRAPKGETATLARGFIKELSDELAREDKSRPDNDNKPGDDEDDKVDPRDDKITDEPDRPDPGRSKRRIGLVIMAVGVVGMGVGTGFAIRSSSINQEFDGVVWDPDKQGRFDQGKSAQIFSYVGLGIGAVAVTTGAVLYLLNRGSRSTDSGDDEEGVSLGASASETQATLWLRGRF